VPYSQTAEKIELKFDRAVVACLGASITAAKGSFDWIGELARRPQNARFLFHNFGVGGDLAYNALQRLPDVIAYHPRRVVVIVGHNDVIACVSPKVRRIFSRWKHLPVAPSLDWYRENIRAIARRLQSGTSAQIAFSSLSPIGENLASANPFQRQLNQRIQHYSAIVEKVAWEEKVGYIPFYERMRDAIAASPGRAFTSFRFLSFYRDAFRHFVLGRPLDEIARVNGWQFHTDGIHLNSRSGLLLADLVQQFLNTP